MKFHIFFVVIFVCVAFFSTAQAEEAEIDSKIAVLDLESVIQDSVAGKGLQRDIKAREDAIQKEANGYRKSLQEKERALISDRKGGMDDKSFEEAKKKFSVSLQESQKKMIEKKVSLEKSKLSALKAIQNNIAKITADIADERKLHIVVDRKFVVIAEQSLDITDLVLKRLDSTVKSIPLK